MKQSVRRAFLRIQCCNVKIGDQGIFYYRGIWAWSLRWGRKHANIWWWWGNRMQRKHTGHETVCPATVNDQLGSQRGWGGVTGGESGEGEVRGSCHAGSGSQGWLTWCMFMKIILAVVLTTDYKGARVEAEMPVRKLDVLSWPFPCSQWNDQ